MLCRCRRRLKTWNLGAEMGAYFIEGKPFSPEKLSPEELLAKAKSRREEAERVSSGIARQSILLEVRHLETQASVEKLLRTAASQ